VRSVEDAVVFFLNTRLPFLPTPLQACRPNSPPCPPLHTPGPFCLRNVSHMSPRWVDSFCGECFLLSFQPPSGESLPSLPLLFLSILIVCMKAPSPALTGPPQEELIGFCILFHQHCLAGVRICDFDYDCLQSFPCHEQVFLAPPPPPI